MDETDFGQIKIYNDIFDGITDISGNALECINNGTTYHGLYDKKEVPIMIGSKFDFGPNPLKINGYFVVDGICKFINNIKIDMNIRFGKDYCRLTDNSFIKIENMYSFKQTINKDKEKNIKKLTKKWYLPLNYTDLLKYSTNPTRLKDHLSIILKIDKNKNSKILKNEIDLIHLCYMFECWLGIRDKPPKLWRLLTPGEILKESINLDIIKSFRLNKWFIRGTESTSISENLKHYNIISDIESIRRITLKGNRELVKLDQRSVKLEDKGKICPIQTSDGSICGTVSYLCKNAKVINNDLKIPFQQGNDIHIFINSEYNGKTSFLFIEKLKKLNYKIIKIDNVVYCYYQKGMIIKSDYILSYTASLLKYTFHNPPIRSMFACSMLKQNLMEDSRNIRLLIDNTKFIINTPPKLIVAIMPWYGYNIEDSIVVSENVSNKYKYIKTRIYSSNNCVILSKYVSLNSIVKIGDPLYKIFDENEVKTVSIIYAENDGIVEQIIHSSKLKLIKIVVSKLNKLIVGDKMTSLHGQKGVVSLIEKVEDMPYYYNDGKKIHIDLLINPHAFPSRMTMGQILEMGNKEHDVYIKNDKKLKNKIIVGPCEYLSLRHQVLDKLQHRNKGDYDIITKQPITGRKKHGGLRFGQMERDILISLDAWKTINELWSIDSTNIKWCPLSGKFNLPNCNTYKKVNQYFILCLTSIRSLGYDILLKDDKYSIVLLDISIIPKTSSLSFGDLDPLDLRIMDDVMILPICLRSNNLKKLYKKLRKTPEKNLSSLKIKIEKELTSILKSKKGLWHKYFEGHIIDKSIRSVITPDPSLPLDTVLIPLESNIDCDYALLNRQPSLNTDSLKLVKIKQGLNKTISINPKICKLFNADFDGDEMNIYGIVNKDSINELALKMFINDNPIQDYLLCNGDLKTLTENGITANKEGFKTMIQNKSKGSQFNYDLSFNKIGDLMVNSKIYSINSCYMNGLSADDWYILSMQSRHDIASIALNTPITGYLQSLCLLRFI